MIQHWFRWWFGTDQPRSHNLDQLWPSSLTHISVTRLQCVWCVYVSCAWLIMEITFIAVSLWKSNRYIPHLGVSDLKPQIRGLPLNITICGSVASYNQEIAHTFQCLASGITGRYVVLQSIGERDHLLVVYEVMVYGYGKISNIYLNKWNWTTKVTKLKYMQIAVFVNVCCLHQCHPLL